MRSGVLSVVAAGWVRGAGTLERTGRLMGFGGAGRGGAACLRWSERGLCGSGAVAIGRLGWRL